MSEQVSHHPPISACWAESPLWHYYGEVCLNEIICAIFFVANVVWIGRCSEQIYGQIV